MCFNIMIWCVIGVDSSADAGWPLPTAPAQELCLVLRYTGGENRHGPTTLYCHFVFAIWLSYLFCEEFFPCCSDSLLKCTQDKGSFGGQQWLGPL